MAKLSDVLGTSFDSSSVEPQQSFDLLPAGVYIVEILDAEVRANSKGTGTILKLQHSVIDPEKFANRRIFKSINLQHTNAQAEQIGRSELSALCRAVGIPVLNDSDELIGKVVKAKVAIRAARDGYEAQNEIKSYESAQIAPPPKQAPAQVNSRATPPWAK